MSKYTDTIDLAVKAGDTDTIRELYDISDILTENLAILYVDDSPLLEWAVRVLTRVDLRYKCINGTFTLINFPEKYDLFVKFFAWLESVSDQGTYDLPEEFIILLKQVNVPESDFYTNWKLLYTDYKVIEIQDDPMKYPPVNPM